MESPVESPDERAARIRRSSRWLMGHGPRTPRATLEALLVGTDASVEADSYGEGAVAAGLERRVAELLGKEAALFFPSGVMAQQTALRVHADRAGSRLVGLHPRSHLVEHERHPLEIVHGLCPIHLGAPGRLFGAADVAGAGERLAAVSIEIPQRELGCRLPSWEELVATCAAVRDRAAACHMDGARLWESQPFYGRPLPEIAALFDSVYVSFYKGLGGIAGAALAGTASFVAEARTWRRRLGGTLVEQWPMLLAAARGLELQLPRMAEYRERALELAAAFCRVPGVRVTPDPPHTNQFLVVLEGRRPIREALLDLAEASGIWVARGSATPYDGLQCFEMVVGSATMDVPVSDVAALVARLRELIV